MSSDENSRVARRGPSWAPVAAAETRAPSPAVSPLPPVSPGRVVVDRLPLRVAAAGGRSQPPAAASPQGERATADVESAGIATRIVPDRLCPVSVRAPRAGRARFVAFHAQDVHRHPDERRGRRSVWRPRIRSRQPPRLHRWELDAVNLPSGREAKSATRVEPNAFDQWWAGPRCWEVRRVVRKTPARCRRDL